MLSLNSWIPLQLVADWIYSFNVVVEKEALARHKVPRAMMLFSVALVTLPFALAGLPLLFSAGLLAASIALLVGALYILSGWAYYQALSTGSPFLVSLAFQSGPLFTLAFSAGLIGERLDSSQYIMFCAFLVAGSWATLVEASVKKQVTQDTIEDGVVGTQAPSRRGSDGYHTFRWAVAGAALSALSSTLTNWLLLHGYNSLDAFLVSRPGVVIMTLLLIGWIGTRSSVATLWRGRKQPEVLLMVLGVQVLRLGSRYLTIAATKQVGSASLTSALSSVDPLYVWVLSSLFKQERGPSSARVRAARFGCVAIIIVATLYSAIT
ncbi:MAG: hypothetical protein M3441_06545 [Chloroflexota bacterium]|nr:hypothetical protein [Chloroflexota bacterium]